MHRFFRFAQDDSVGMAYRRGVALSNFIERTTPSLSFTKIN
jgi:hypothetical protein